MTIQLGRIYKAKEDISDIISYGIPVQKIPGYFGDDIYIISELSSGKKIHYTASVITTFMELIR